MKMNENDISYELEEAIRRALQIQMMEEEDAFLRQLRADYIEYPFQSFMIGIGYMYKTSEDYMKKDINDFIDKYEYCSHLTIKEILSFEISHKFYKENYFQFTADNGIQLLLNMIDEYNQLAIRMERKN